MKVRTHPLLRRAAVPALLVSLGITVGSYARGGARAEPPARRTTGSGEPPHVERPIAPAPLPLPVGLPVSPEAPSLQLPSPAPGFGGPYAMLRGAAGVGGTEPAWHAVPEGVESSDAVADPRASLPGAESAPADSTAPTVGAAAGRGLRRSPAQGIPGGLALRHPLLAHVREGGRVAVHDLGLRGAPEPAGIEGEWAVIGVCHRTLRIDFALPAIRAGGLRGIGRADPAPEWRIEPVVARQACVGAGDRYARARPAGEGERGRYGALGEGFGFGAEDLVRLTEIRGSALLLFRRTGSGAALVAASTGSAPAAVWRHRIEAADGDVEFLGVYRIGAGAEAWLILGNPSAPEALLIATSTDGRRWEAPVRAPLRER